MADISTPYEVDAYSFHLFPNIDYIAAVVWAETGSGLTLPDPWLAVVNPVDQSLIGYIDTNISGTKDAAMSFQVPYESDYLLGVTDLTGGTGSYSSSIRDPNDIFQPGTAAGEFIYDPLTMTLTPISSEVDFV
jgi:hypothetical protein